MPVDDTVIMSVRPGVVLHTLKVPGSPIYTTEPMATRALAAEIRHADDEITALLEQRFNLEQGTLSALIDVQCEAIEKIDVLLIYEAAAGTARTRSGQDRMAFAWPRTAPDRPAAGTAPETAAGRPAGTLPGQPGWWSWLPSREGQGWPRWERQRRRRSYQIDVREGDFPPVPAPEARLDHTGQCVLPG